MDIEPQFYCVQVSRAKARARSANVEPYLLLFVSIALPHHLPWPNDARFARFCVSSPHPSVPTPPTALVYYTLLHVIKSKIQLFVVSVNGNVN